MLRCHMGHQDSLLHLHIPQLDTSLHCAATNNMLAHGVVCLLLHSFYWYSFCLSQRDGEVELTLVVDCWCKLMTETHERSHTHLSTNWARRSVTRSTETTALPLC